MSDRNNLIRLPSQSQLIPQITSVNNHDELRIRFVIRKPIADLRLLSFDPFGIFQVCHIELDLSQ